MWKSQPSFHGPLGRGYYANHKTTETKLKFHKIKETLKKTIV